MAASPDQELNNATTPRSRWARATDDASRDDARAAFRELVETYWYCTYAWWRRAGLDAAHAGRATLASFTRWLGETPPRASDAGAARMREWMPARLAELAAAGVKLAGPAAIEIDPVFAEHRYAEEPPGEPDAIFQRRWTLTVLECAVAKLRAEYTARGEETLFAELLAFAGFASDDHERYSDAATRTGRTTDAIRRAVFDFRTRQREVMIALVADTLLDASDTESEITALLCACDMPGATDAPLPTALRELHPDEILARAMQTVRMSGRNARDWQPPSVEKTARLFPNYEVLRLLYWQLFICRSPNGTSEARFRTAIRRALWLSALPCAARALRSVSLSRSRLMRRMARSLADRRD